MFIIKYFLLLPLFLTLLPLCYRFCYRQKVSIYAVVTALPLCFCNFYAREKKNQNSDFFVTFYKVTIFFGNSGNSGNITRTEALSDPARWLQQIRHHPAFLGIHTADCHCLGPASAL
jgi:hypothetical protein